MRLAAAAILLCLAVSGCGRGFVAMRDYGRVAECYAAFFSVHMDAQDPDLGLGEAEIAAQAQVTLKGINRMTPFIIEAKNRAGGDQPFIALVAAWRRKPENNIRTATSLERKQAIYKRAQDEAARCHDTLNRWGASQDYRAASPPAA